MKKVNTPKYWTNEIFQPLVEVETAYGNKVKIPKEFLNGWQTAKMQREDILRRKLEPLAILMVGEDENPDKENNPMYFDLEQVFYEIYEI